VGVVALACHSRYYGKHKIRGLQSKKAWVKNKTLSQKVNSAKRTIGTAQAVECQTSKCEVLSSNPHIPPKRNKQKKKRNNNNNL
jgi:hypothetical protein